MMVLYVLEDSHLAVVKKKLYSFFQVCGIKVVAVALLVYAKKNHRGLPSSTSNIILMGIKSK